MIIDRLQLSLPSADIPKDRRAQDSAELRKRMVAAYLSICAELNYDVRYASANMVFQMSDKCIRDYLSQMDEIFLQSGLELEEFTSRQVPPLQQNIAIRRASEKKREYVPKSGVGSPVETLRLVEALGSLTQRIQASRNYERSLRVSERGIFVVSRQLPSPDMEAILNVIAQAAEAGFFKIIKQSQLEWQFRVHCSLAAAFGFSYRGAYYLVQLRSADLQNLFASIEEEQREKTLVSIENRLDGEPETSLPLFKDLELQ